MRNILSYLKRDRASHRGSDDWTVIVGLGNPGREYAENRHNIGFLCIDHIATEHEIRLNKSRFKAVFGEGRLGGHRVVLVKPQTFMNKSGAAVAPVARWYKVDPNDILVIYDDLDLPFGRVRLRPEGSSGGHNGIKSIIADLGTTQFPRIRIGIGRPRHGDPVDYVLNDFDREQAPFVPDICAHVDRAVQTFLAQGIKEAMNTFNGLEPIAPPLN